MKQVRLLIVIGLVGALMMAGCAKAPVQVIEDAKAKVESVINADTETYAAEELNALKQNLEAALAEVKAQDGKLLFKKYDKAQEMLTAVTAEAENLPAIAAQRKAEAEAAAAAAAKEAALTAQNEATEAINALKALLDMVPPPAKGKKPKVNVATYKTAVAEMEASVAGLDPSIEAAAYEEVTAVVTAVKEKAATLTEEVQAALNKK
ncbi:MAG: hypothetical protein ACOZBW_11650 [Thermodesulfobacteriota bacterium]